jgi:hypothetical protein
VVIMLIAAVVAPVLIVWYAWKSKKETWVDLIFFLETAQMLIPEHKERGGLAV